jgi:hypothetical protein
MESPFWHVVGMIGAIGYPTLLVVAIAGPRLFASSDPRKAKLGGLIMIYLGGLPVMREVDAEMRRRKLI